MGLLGGGEGKGFILNVDQSNKRPLRKIPKPVLFVAGFMALAVTLGGLAWAGDEAENRAVRTSDEEVPEGDSIKNYDIKQIIQVDTVATPKYNLEKKATPSVKSHDLQLVKSNSPRTGDDVSVSRSCDKTTDRVIRSVWEVHYPDGKQSSAYNVDVCFVYGDHAFTTIEFRHAQHGTGDYTTKATLYEEKVSFCWRYACYKTTEIPYTKAIPVTDDSWNWFD